MPRGAMRHINACAACLGLSLRLAALAIAAEVPSVETIIQQSVAADQRDWNAEPEYSYTETTTEGDNSKTYDVTMLFGSPYRRLIQVNGKPIPPRQQEQEQQKFDQAVNQRRSESPAETKKRIADYEKDRRRDHLLMEQLSKAFDFNLKGESTLAGRDVYVLSATPRKGYQPPVTDARVLTGMRGTLWIDKATSQWVRVRAEVISPVSIEGFLARVEPGTWFELEKMPVTDDIWLTRHFSMKSRARILFLFNHHADEDDIYSDYHKTPPEYLRKTETQVTDAGGSPPATQGP